MADLTSDAIASNFNKFNISQSDAGRELVISATKSGGLLDADILAVYRQLTVAGGAGKDAATVAAFGTANGTFQKDAITGLYENGAGDTLTVVYFRVQTTGTPDTTTVSGVTLATVAIFAPAL
jgi:hypothetical protein